MSASVAPSVRARTMKSRRSSPVRAVGAGLLVGLGDDRLPGRRGRRRGRRDGDGRSLDRHRGRLRAHCRYGGRFGCRWRVAHRGSGRRGRRNLVHGRRHRIRSGSRDGCWVRRPSRRLGGRSRRSGAEERRAEHRGSAAEHEEESDHGDESPARGRGRVTFDAGVRVGGGAGDLRGIGMERRIAGTSRVVEFPTGHEAILEGLRKRGAGEEPIVRLLRKGSHDGRDGGRGNALRKRRERRRRVLQLPNAEHVGRRGLVREAARQRVVDDDGQRVLVVGGAERGAGARLRGHVVGGAGVIPVGVRPVSREPSAFAMPKSARNGLPRWSKRMFPGFTLRWTTCSAWIWSRVSAMRRSQGTTSEGVRRFDGACFKRSPSDPPPRKARTA